MMRLIKNTMKQPQEINKAVWLIVRTSDQKIIDRYRSGVLARRKLRELNKFTKEVYELKRDNQWSLKNA